MEIVRYCNARSRPVLTRVSYIVYIALIAMYFVLIWFFFPETKYVFRLQSPSLRSANIPVGECPSRRSLCCLTLGAREMQRLLFCTCMGRMPRMSTSKLVQRNNDGQRPRRLVLVDDKYSFKKCSHDKLRQNMTRTICFVAKSAVPVARALMTALDVTGFPDACPRPCQNCGRSIGDGSPAECAPVEGC